MAHDDVDSGGIRWVRGLLAGAVLGGIGWGPFTALIVGTSGNQAHLSAIIGPRMTLAVAVSSLCLALGVALIRARLQRTVAIALIVASASGWIVFGLLYLQNLVLR